MYDFLMGLTSEHRAEVVSQMRKLRAQGTKAARHLRGDIYEVRAFIDKVGYRVLFAEEGRYSEVLLSLEAYQKHGQRTPDHEIDLAERRLRDWRGRPRMRYTK